MAASSLVTQVFLTYAIDMLYVMRMLKVQCCVLCNEIFKVRLFFCCSSSPEAGLYFGPRSLQFAFWNVFKRDTEFQKSTWQTTWQLNKSQKLALKKKKKSISWFFLWCLIIFFFTLWCSAAVVTIISWYCKVSTGVSYAIKHTLNLSFIHFLERSYFHLRRHGRKL